MSTAEDDSMTRPAALTPSAAAAVVAAARGSATNTSPVGGGNVWRNNSILEKNIGQIGITKLRYISVNQSIGHSVSSWFRCIDSHKQYQLC